MAGSGTMLSTTTGTFVRLTTGSTVEDSA